MSPGLEEALPRLERLLQCLGEIGHIKRSDTRRRAVAVAPDVEIVVAVLDQVKRRIFGCVSIRFSRQRVERYVEESYAAMNILADQSDDTPFNCGATKLVPPPNVSWPKPLWSDV